MLLPEIGAGDLADQRIVHPAQPLDVFREDSSALWRDVMRRQPGELAWHSTRPVDPDLN